MKVFALCMAAVFLIGNTVYAAEKTEIKEKTAIPVHQTVVWDGTETKMPGYNIDGYAYFRLRDVAKMVSAYAADEKSYFDLDYQKETNTISIVTGKGKYMDPAREKVFDVGTEEKKAFLADTTVVVDRLNGLADKGIGEGYVIDGYNFYKLGRIVGALGMQLNWCKEENVVEIVSLPKWDPNEPVVYRKPVIYLYPEKTMDVSVKLDYAGDLTVTYPTYQDGWQVTAQPDGTLTNHADGLEYSYLFWEGNGQLDVDFSEGFVIKGEDTAAFLQKTLSNMGLTPKEYNDFIVYWLPYMQDNAYNLISFQQENYTQQAKLDIQPAPDSVLRVFMAFRPLEKPVEVTPQKLQPFERNGFTVVEWGGSEVR